MVCLTSVAQKIVLIHGGNVPLPRKCIHVSNSWDWAGGTDLTKKTEHTTLEEYALDTQNIPLNVTSPLPIVRTSYPQATTCRGVLHSTRETEKWHKWLQHDMRPFVGTSGVKKKKLTGTLERPPTEVAISHVRWKVGKFRATRDLASKVIWLIVTTLQLAYWSIMILYDIMNQRCTVQWMATTL